MHKKLLQEHYTKSGFEPTFEDDHAAFLEAVDGVLPDGHMHGIGFQASNMYEEEIRALRANSSRVGFLQCENVSLCC